MAANQSPHRVWVRHAPDDTGPGSPDLVTAVPHFDDRVSAEHPEDDARYRAMVAARAAQCAAVEELDAATHTN